MRKGYLCRESGEKDRRVVYVRLTDAGRQAAERHRAFHERMVDSLETRLDDEEWDALTRSLDTLGVFFSAAGGRGEKDEA